MVGYYLQPIVGGTCAPCRSLLGNCSECSANSCIKCKVGYFYNSSTNSCDICSRGCYTCNSLI
jgi:hypothetical protein